MYDLAMARSVLLQMRDTLAARRDVLAKQIAELNAAINGLELATVLLKQQEDEEQ